MDDDLPRWHTMAAIRGRAKRDPDSVALTYEGVTHSWSDLDERARRNAAAQIDAGLRPGDRIAVLDKNHLACLETTLGSSLAGTANAVVNFRLAASELVHVLNDSEARIVLVGHEFRDLIDSIAGELIHTPATIVIGGVSDEYEQWLTSSEPLSTVLGSSADDGFLQLYTSGTTGRPKGAVLTHRSVGAHSVGAIAGFGFDEQSVNLVAMPLFHVGGTCWALAGLAAGSRTVLVRAIDPPVVLDTMAAEHVTHAFFVPAAIAMLAAVPGAADRDLTAMRCLGYGGSPMPSALLATAMATFGVDFFQVYGMTEASGVFCILDGDDHRDVARPDRLHSVGRPVLGTEVRVVDPVTGEPLPAGSIGEFQVRGAQVMAGYWRRETDTAAALDGEWFRTGDAGTVDDGGYFTIRDRVKDIVISGGENIYPAEVERVVADFPGVAEVAVIGVPDERWGESVLAVVVPSGDVALDLDGLAAHCAEHLAAYKRPRRVEVLDALPRNATGKILKRDLRAPFWVGRERAF
jgi:acyl-CoA synthetase (AMP-forming)/AMP-acid ligase II